jgi:iron complex outermembrane receptor protein
VRGRYVDGFPVASGVYIGEVESYAVFDVNVGYTFAGRSGLTLQLDISNIFDDNYQPFVGVPEFGRYSVVRLIWNM